MLPRRAGRAWFCGFEILMFLYSVAFHTNLVFPDVEDQCAAFDFNRQLQAATEAESMGA